MRTVDLIHRKRDGEELSTEEIAYVVDGYTNGTIPDYQDVRVPDGRVFLRHD